MIPGRSIKLFALLICCLVATCFGCAPQTTTGVAIPPSEFTKEIKSIEIHPYKRNVIKTGIHVSRGDYYTLIVEGRVLFNHTLKNSDIPPESVVEVKIDNKDQIAPPINATLASPINGEISLLVKDSVRIWQSGYNQIMERKPLYTPANGSFKATIIVWKTKNIDQILAYFNQIELANPNSEISGKLIVQAQSLKTSLAEAKVTSTPVVTKKTETSATVTVSSPPPKSEPPDTQSIEAATSGPAAPLEDPSPTLSEQKTSPIEVELSTSHQPEVATSVPVVKPEEPSAALSEKEQPSETSKDLYAPVMVLLSPHEGQITTTATIQLVGVVEDDSTLIKIEIKVNGKPINLETERGIIPDSTELSSRFEFNERVPIIVGQNQIQIRAEDTSGRISERLVSIQRVEAKGMVWAVVVGINDYPNLPQLKYAVNDAQAFHDFLIESELVKPDNVFRVINDQATLDSMRSILGTKLKKRARKGDKVIIYFAGHGATERDVNSPDGDGLEKYLLPYNANPDDLYATALPMREISHILNRIQSDSLIFIADSCYSGASGGRTVSIGGIRSTLSDSYIDRIAGGKGRVILTASAANEVSMEDEDLGHGIFTYYLLKGLKGMADYDSDGYVTVDEAYRYVSEEVPKATGQAQNPVKKGSVEGQLVLGVAK